MDILMNDAPNIAQIIQLSVAPVFLLAGIGAILNVVAARLGRAVDRARYLEEVLPNAEQKAKPDYVLMQLAVLDRRIVFAQRSIFFCVVSAFLVCIVVATLFVGALVEVALAALVGILFIAAMMSLIGGLAYFLAEVAIATRMLRVRTDLSKK